MLYDLGGQYGKNLAYAAYRESKSPEKKIYKEISLPILTHHDQLCLSLGSKTRYLLELQDKSKQ